MSLQYLVALRNQWLADLNASLGASAKLLIYSGAEPASASAPATGTLLSSGVRGNGTAWGVVASGVLTAGVGTPDINAAASGQAGYFRWTDNSDNVAMQGTVTLPNQGGDLIMLDTDITAGDTVVVASWLITAPGA